MQSIKELQKQVRNFFGISSTEANAFLILLPVMIVLLLLIPLYPKFFPSKERSFLEDKQTLKDLVAKLQENKRMTTEEYQVEEKILSALDPNTAGFKDLLLLDLDTVIAARIIKYRTSIGNFQYKDDLLKIYGLNGSTYERIKNRISLPDKPLVIKDKTPKLASQDKEITKPDPVIIHKKELLPFNINQADSMKLVEVKGIGPVLSARIIKYRDYLGGFVDTIQYKEVYGLKPEVLKQLYMSAVIGKDFIPAKIKINQAEAKELAGHPYISWKIANAIVAYRKQHGRFETPEQLLKIKIIDHKTLDKLVPYLSL